MKLTVQPVALGALAVGLGLMAAIWLKKKPGESLAGALGGAAVGAVVDTGVGVVHGIGDVVGIPRTEQSQCDADIAAGRTWDASFSCPAGRWLSEALFSGPAYTGGGATPPGGTPPPAFDNPWGGASASW